MVVLGVLLDGVDVGWWMMRWWMGVAMLLCFAGTAHNISLPMRISASVCRERHAMWRGEG